jgi:hypothetical protein
VSGPSERDEVAEVLAVEDKPCRKALAENPDGCVGEYGWCLCRKTADAILPSDWLAERDRRVAAEALREAAEEFDVDAVRVNSSAWRGAYRNRAARLRDRADRIERGA